MKKTLASIVAAAMIATASPAVAAAEESNSSNDPFGQALLVLDEFQESSFDEEGNFDPFIIGSSDLAIVAFVVAVITGMQNSFRSSF